MKRKFLFGLIFLALSTMLCGQPKHEVRAVWLTTIGGIDWPSSYAHDRWSIEKQQQQLCDMLDKLKAVNVNTILLQTRIRATTIYPSVIEPWDGCMSGRPGRSPGYDPLQFAIDECHRRGMELHAWVVTIPIGKWKTYGCQQLRKRYPSMVKRIGDEGYLNPESSQTADYLTSICDEIVNRYDVDGIHLDYIRYPETWRGRKDANNITRIVKSIHQRIKQNKQWIKLSCSPIGKYDDLSRYSSRGWNAHKKVAQDAQDWLRDGLMDQLYPMMYFKGNNFYPFAIDWQEHNYRRTVVSGLGTYMLSPHENNWPLTEVKRQLNVTRNLEMGHCHFRAKFLLDNIKGIYEYMLHFDNHPALIPPLTWEWSIAPQAPTILWVDRTPQGDNLSWIGAKDNSNGPYLLYNVYASTEEPVDIDNPANLIATRCMQNHVSLRRGADKPTLHYAVTALDRYGNESIPIYDTTPTESKPGISYLLLNDGKYLVVPHQQVDAQLLTVSDMQGRIVATYLYKAQINISQLPEGMYTLRTLGKKDITHRLGHFIIKR